MSLNNFSIVALHPNAINFIIKGMIIGKSNMKTFEKPDQKSRSITVGGVINLLIRDSRDNFINLTVWGEEDFIADYNSKFTIGHVVNVVNSRVVPVRFDDPFNPITSSQLELSLNQGVGSLELCEGDTTWYVNLLNVPLKSQELALTLADIVSTRPSSNSGELVDLCVVVAKLMGIRQIKNNYVRDVIVFDQTVPGMILTIWNQAWIERSNSWNEMSTTLHLINVAFKYSEYNRSNILVYQSRTIIIVDPIGERSKSLKDYAKTSNLILSDFDTAEPDLNTIKAVMSLRQITDRANDSSSDPVFYCLCYAIVTQMDIDGWTRFYSRRCIHCNCKIKLKDISCEKENCSIFFAESPLYQHYINYFDIPIHLTDHTGTLDQCRLIGDTAERILGHSLTDFLKLSDGVRSAIKFNFLMERCSVKLSIKRKSALRWKPQITIVDCQVANPSEVLEKIKIY